MMWMLWKGLVLGLFVGDFIAAQHAGRYQDAAFPPDLSRFFENFTPFPFERSSGFSPYGSSLSPWRTPEITMFADLPPIVAVPRVEVFCDDSSLTVVVDKRSFVHTLAKEDLQLGDSCSSNSERPDKFVFSYRLDQCGTTHVMQGGRRVFSNSLHLNLKKTPANWWQTPSSIHISCMPVRSKYPNAAWTPPERKRHFNISPMSLSWSRLAESNVYERGEVVNLQISASINPAQQLFVQSCFVSASPEPQTRPRHAVISNQGCATAVGSHPIVQFVMSDRANVVNFVLNTSQLISELYVHCTVLVSAIGVTYGSKSCNYNAIQARWEELTGDGTACDCCSSKCKGLWFQSLPGTKATVSTGPFVIVDKFNNRRPMHPDHEPQTMSEPIPNHTEMETPRLAEDAILSGASVSRCKLSSPGRGVVAVRQNGDGRRTLWLPGQAAEDCDDSPGVPNAIPELQTPIPQQESHPNLLSNELEGSAVIWDAHALTMVDGWSVSPQAEIAEEFRREGRMGDPLKGNTKMANGDDFLPTEVGLDIMVVEDAPSAEVVKKSQRNKRFSDVKVNGKQDLKETRDESGPARADDRADMEPVLRAKFEFSESADGSKKLSYEEEVMRQRRGRSVIAGFVRNVRKRQEPSLKGLLSAFLSLLRRLDKE